MPTATPFTALVDGDGGLCYVPAFDCTIGRAEGNPSFSRIIEDYITLGGHRGSTGGRASEAQIRKSFINAMKMIWNFHGVDVSGGLTSASASSSKDVDLSYTKVVAGDPDPIRTPLSWSISTSAEVSASKSFPSVDIESREPISRVCNRYSGSSSSFSVNEGVSESDTDTGEATDGGITVYSQSSANLALSGVGVGPPYGYSFAANLPGVAAFFDDGVFVGYGVTNLFSDASYEISTYASGGGSEQPISNVYLVCSFSLGGVTYEGSVTGLNPDNIETKKITLDGIPFLYQAGYYDSLNGQIELSFTGNTAKFVGTGSTLDGNTQTITRPDTSSIEDYIQTITITNQSQFEFKFKINGLDFYTY